MTDIGLKKIYSGKVRDLYEIDEHRMLMVASDRLSAFDVILPDPIVGKGEILTAISNFWFQKLAHIMPNHFTGDSVEDVLPQPIAQNLKNRAVVVKRLTPVKCEAIVRGYISGSGWKSYQQTGEICGIRLPEDFGGGSFSEQTGPKTACNPASPVQTRLPGPSYSRTLETSNRSRQGRACPHHLRRV